MLINKILTNIDGKISLPDTSNEQTLMLFFKDKNEQL